MTEYQIIIILENIYIKIGAIILVQKLLKNSYLFKDLADADIDQIARIISVSNFGPGKNIFNQGEDATSMYVVKSGSVKICQKGSKGEDIVVSSLGTGSLFGEMAFIDGEKRSATATVSENTEIVILPYGELIDVLRSNDNVAITFFMAMSKFLCHRLRTTTNDLSSAKAKNIGHF